MYLVPTSRSLSWRCSHCKLNITDKDKHEASGDVSIWQMCCLSPVMLFNSAECVNLTRWHAVPRGSKLLLWLCQLASCILTAWHRKACFLPIIACNVHGSPGTPASFSSPGEYAYPSIFPSDDLLYLYFSSLVTPSEFEPNFAGRCFSFKPHTNPNTGAHKHTQRCYHEVNCVRPRCNFVPCGYIVVKGCASKPIQTALRSGMTSAPFCSDQFTAEPTLWKRCPFFQKFSTTTFKWPCFVVIYIYVKFSFL